MSIKLLQGDCLEKMKDIPDGSVDLVLCDLPYGTTDCHWDVIIPFKPMWKQLKRIIKKKGVMCLFGAQPFTSMLIMSNLEMFKYVWIWEKSKVVGFPNANRQPLRNCEDIAVFYNKQPLYNPQGLHKLRIPKIMHRKKSLGECVYAGVNDESLCTRYFQKYGNYPTQVLLKMNVPGGKVHHPTQKPVPLMSYLIKTYTNEGATVLDFCMGSGTTGVACKNLNRDFVGIEKDPTIFEIAKRRINNKVVLTKKPKEVFVLKH
jgi:site-specific DNA-methyltransferase (adenine-specific)